MKIRESYVWTAFATVLVCSGAAAVKFISAAQATPVPATPPAPPVAYPQSQTQPAEAESFAQFLPPGSWRPDEIQFGIAMLKDQDLLARALGDLEHKNNAMQARFEKEFAAATEAKRIADTAAADHASLMDKIEALEAENQSLSLELEAFKAYCASRGLPTTMKSMLDVSTRPHP